MYVSVSTDGRVVPSLGWHTSPQLGPEEKGDQSTIAIGIEWLPPKSSLYST